MRETLRIWPTLPIDVSGEANDIEDVDDIVVALEQRDRVRQISLDSYPSFHSLGTVVSAMLVPFPALKYLYLMVWADDVQAPVIPDTFLGGSAPRLQTLFLRGISFPALPNLLFSARGLVDLTLLDIPRSGTFLPEAIVNSSSELSRLETLRLEFRSRRSCPVPGSRSPLVARAAFPALYQLRFEGTPEYLGDLVSRIDAPMIRNLDVTFFNQPFVTSDFYQLGQFIGRAENFQSLTHAHIELGIHTAEVSLSQRTQTYDATLSVGILCKNLHPRLWSLAQVGSASLLPLSKVESLEVSGEPLAWQIHQEPEEDGQWLNVLQPFSAVKLLYPRESILPSLAYALHEVPEERITEVLPALRVIFTDEPPPPAVQEAIGPFIATRRLLIARREARLVAG